MAEFFTAIGPLAYLTYLVENATKFQDHIANFLKVLKLRFPGPTKLFFFSEC